MAEPEVGARHIGDDSSRVRGAIIATPGKARPYAVVLRRRGAILRSEPVGSLDEGDRLLLRLLAEAAAEDGQAGAA
jgi:hypothetical protein